MQRSLMMVVVTSVAVSLGLSTMGVAWGQSHPDARIMLHAKGHATKAINICPGGTAPEDPNSEGIPCSQYNVGPWPIRTSADVYLMVTMASQGPGIAGVSCGIQFDASVGMFGWSLCSDLDFPSAGWPANGGGNRITWVGGTNCQQTVIGGDGVHAVAGSFYVYAYGDGRLEVTENTGIAIPELRVADCSASESDVHPLAAGKVGFGSMEGYNPCLVTPVQRATWGAIKTLYNR